MPCLYKLTPFVPPLFSKEKGLGGEFILDIYFKTRYNNGNCIVEGLLKLW